MSARNVAISGSVIMLTESRTNACAEPLTDQTLNLILTLTITLTYLQLNNTK